MKVREKFTDGPVNVYRANDTSLYLPDILKQVAQHTVIERNAFFGHHENLLVAIIFIQRKRITEIRLKRVLKVKKNNQTFFYSKTQF